MKLMHRPNTTQTFSKRLYTVPYYFRGHKYLALHKLPRGPSYIRKITALQDYETVEVDVTDYLRMFAGPAEDFQGNSDISPDTFGYSELIFYFSDGRIRSFKRFDHFNTK
jgi:hypothetical protein